MNLNRINIEMVRDWLALAKLLDVNVSAINVKAKLKALGYKQDLYTMDFVLENKNGM